MAASRRPQTGDGKSFSEWLQAKRGAATARPAAGTPPDALFTLSAAKETSVGGMGARRPAPPASTPGERRPGADAALWKAVTPATLAADGGLSVRSRAQLSAGYLPSGRAERRCADCGNPTAASKFCPETGRKHSERADDDSRSAGSAPVADRGGQWRSEAIFHEVRLKELLADDFRLPDATRLEKVWQHYDAISEKVPELRGVFELVKSELQTSIYASGVTVTGAVDRVPYFEALAALTRDNDELRGEVSELKKEAQHDTLRYDVDALRSQCAYLQHQNDRLKQESEAMLEDVTKLTRANEAIQLSGREAFSNLERQYRTVQDELRQSSITNAQLSHDARMRQTTLAEYTHAKHEHTRNLRAMFSDTVARQTVVHMRLQLEAAENQHIDQYDTEMLRAPQEEWASLRTRFVNCMRLVLEEQHLLELLQRDVLRCGEDSDDEDEQQPPGAECAAPSVRTGSRAGSRRSSAATPSPSREPDGSEQFSTAAPSAVEVQRKMTRRETAERLPGGPARRQSSRRMSTGGREDGGRSETVREFLRDVEITQIIAGGGEVGTGAAQEARTRFVANLLKDLPPSSEATAVAALGDLPSRLHGAAGKDALADGKDLVVPLLDCDAARFHGERFELHTSAGKDLPMELLRKVVTIDPSGSFELPPRATHVQLKYLQPRQSRPRPTRAELSFGQRDDLVRDSQRAIRVRDELRSALSRQMLESVAGGSHGKDGNSSVPAWTFLVQKNSGWRPRLPRVLTVLFVEHLVCLTYAHHSSSLLAKFLTLSADGSATQRERGLETGVVSATSPVERLFADSLQGDEIASSLISVLERRYHLPEVVAKVSYETLLACDVHAEAVPHLKDFTSALGCEQDIASGKVLSLSLALVSERWPLSVHQMDEKVTQKDLTAVLEDLYPSAGAHLDDIVSDVAIHTQTDFTLRKVREYFSAAVSRRKEHYVRRALEHLQFKTSTLHWSELDRSDFVDACTHLVQQSSWAGRMHMSERLQLRHIEACFRTGPKGRTRLPPSHLCLLLAEAEWEQVAVRVNASWLQR
eukprot:TRINITY_DN27897_c0_g1_i1.p1 TRINITY_DN27897_c0_g1~~TRINITY_DN27897_c0_g1_i1.p1  ORF type:complete len:1061 (+),score=302.52 TRINITY_DN27897_c0_g1_i1:58-3183(+)